MAQLQLSIALGPYDHTRDVTDGRIQVEGVDLLPLTLPIEEIFYRFVKFREFDISELSFGKYVALRSQGDESFVALPVFISRAFRHSSIYVAANSGLTDLAQLRGKSVGVPEWAQTASVYSRGLLATQAGVPLNEVDWVQAGVNTPGRGEKVKLNLPAGLRYRAEPAKSLNDMLLAGELAAAFSARPPRSLGDGIVRMYPDYAAREEAYFRETRVFPIMHVLAVRGELLKAHPWLAMNLYKAFTAAKDASMARLSDITAAHAPFAWLADYAARMRGLFGADFWPYGIEPNRPTLEAFLRYAYEQGVCHRLLTPEEIFPREVQSSFKV
jgi:4,5-dihydroxyphthalate decarboxylase